jgi:hypothetical protein
LRGPRLTVLNLSLGKEFHFGERFALQLRADFVNALNHPNFQAPHSDIGSACVVAGGAAIPCETSNFGIIDASAPGFGLGNSNGIAVCSTQRSAECPFHFLTIVLVEGKDGVVRRPFVFSNAHVLKTSPLCLTLA